MVAPDGHYGLFQDDEYVLSMAHQVKEMGFQLLLDFHYSHWWTDRSNQWCPLIWRNESNADDEDTISRMEDLQGQVYNHTFTIMQALHEKDITPDAVQIGNSISDGFLWDHGKLPWGRSNKTDDELPQEWIHLVQLLTTGIQAVKDVSKSTRIVIHLDTGGDIAYTEAWMQTYLRLGGQVDILGLSWYPMWHRSMDDLRQNINNIKYKFPALDVWVVETAYFWSGSCDERHNDCTKQFPYPMTEQGQYDFLQELRNTLETTACSAVFYFGSHWTQLDKWFTSDFGETWDDMERRSLFDKSGRVLKGMSAWTNR